MSSGATGSVRVTIFGDEYSVRSDVDTTTTKRVAEYVSMKMAETCTGVSSRDKVKVAVLSAMNIAGELFDKIHRGELRENELIELENRTKEIGRKIDNALVSL